ERELHAVTPQCAEGETLTQVGQVGAVPFAVLTHHLPRDGDAGHQRVQGQGEGRPLRIAGYRGADNFALVLLDLRDQAPGRPWQRAPGQRGDAAAIDVRRHLDDVVRVEEGQAGAVAGVDDHRGRPAAGQGRDHRERDPLVAAGAVRPGAGRVQVAQV